MKSVALTYPYVVLESSSSIDVQVNGEAAVTWNAGTYTLPTNGLYQLEVSDDATVQYSSVALSETVGSGGSPVAVSNVVRVVEDGAKTVGQTVASGGSNSGEKVEVLLLAHMYLAGEISALAAQSDYSDFIGSLGSSPQAGHCVGWRYSFANSEAAGDGVELVFTSLYASAGVVYAQVGLLGRQTRLTMAANWSSPATFSDHASNQINLMMLGAGRFLGVSGI